MKFFLTIALIATVASAAVIRTSPMSAEVQEIIAAIQSPSTDPATAAALGQMLLDVLGVKPEPVVIGPVLLDTEPVSIGPAWIDIPLPEGAIVEEPAIIPEPVSIVEGPAASATASAPLVQIILNINQAAATNPIAVSPVVIPETIQPEPVHVVESAAEPVQVVETAPVPVEPVQVVEIAPVEIEPVIIGVPVIPEPIVTLPEGGIIIPETAIILP